MVNPRIQILAVALLFGLFACAVDTQTGSNRADESHQGSTQRNVSERAGNTAAIAALTESLQQRLNEMRTQWGFPGASVGLVLPDGAGLSFATGFADEESVTAMQPSSYMRSASIGKVYVGAVITQLSNSGRLSLDDPLSKWLGHRLWFERLPNADSITLAQLLNHSAGIPDHLYTDEFAKQVPKLLQNPDLVFSPEQLVEFILDKEPLFEPGHGFQYTDTGFVLLGLVIEELTRQDFYTVVQARLFSRLNLNGMRSGTTRSTPNLAQGYSADQNPFGLPARALVDGRLTTHPGNEYAGGGWFSTAPDLARIMFALFGGALVDKNYGEKVSQHTAQWPGKGRYGLGVGLFDTPLGCSFTHGGWTPGYLSNAAYYPDSGIAVAVMVNTDDRVRMQAAGGATQMQMELAALAQRMLPAADTQRRVTGFRCDP